MVRKKIGIALMAMIFMVAGSAQAQESDDVDVDVTIIGALDMTTVQDATFGNVSATTAGIVYLDPTEQASAYVGGTADAGEVTITGAVSQGITIQWPTSLDLISATPDTLNCDLEVSGGTTSTQTSSAVITSGQAGITTSAGGAYYLWVGGELGGVAGTPAPLSTQPAGAYSGTASFTVEYN